MARARYYLVSEEGQITYVSQDDEKKMDNLLDKEGTLEGYVIIDTADGEFYHPDGEGGSIELHEFDDELDGEEEDQDE